MTPAVCKAQNPLHPQQAPHSCAMCPRFPLSLLGLMLLCPRRDQKCRGMLPLTRRKAQPFFAAHRWWKKCPLAVEHFENVLLSQQTSFYLFASNGFAKAQWYGVLQWGSAGDPPRPAPPRPAWKDWVDVPGCGDMRVLAMAWRRGWFSPRSKGGGASAGGGAAQHVESMYDDFSGSVRAASNVPHLLPRVPPPRPRPCSRAAFRTPLRGEARVAEA